MSLPGDRLGFFAILPTMDSPDEIWAAACGAARIMGYICVSPLMQMVISECIGATSDFSVYKENRELLCDALQNMGFRFPNSDGTFYLFLDTFNSDSRTFCANDIIFCLFLVSNSVWRIMLDFLIVFQNKLSRNLCHLFEN